MCTERKPCIPEWTDACPGAEVRAVVQVLLLLQAGSTPVMPEEAQGLVPDSSSGNGRVTQLNKLNSQYQPSCKQG